MLRRAFLVAGALALIVAALGFAMAGPAAAQEGEPDRPPPCPPGETCVEPPIPCPVDGEPCEVPDADGDGYFDFDEEYWGSDPNDASSTPEHAYLPETCADSVDNDGDGATDMVDTGCRFDSDGDGWPDLTDNCPYDSNAVQTDADGDGVGDACDYDADNDGWDDETERMAGSDPNDAASTPEHAVFGTCEDGLDNDADGLTDAADPGCAPDGDFDFVPDDADNCPTVWNEDQADTDRDGTGDACEDSDGDGHFDVDEEAFGSDPNDASSTPEVPWLDEACTDGRDNDGDGATDDQDENCRVYLEIYSPAADRGLDGDEEVQPLALPAAGSGPAGGTDTSLALIALAGAALVAGSGLVFVGARAARKAPPK